MATIAQARAAARGARGYTATHPLPWVRLTAHSAILAAQAAHDRLNQRLSVESAAVGANDDTTLSPRGERLYKRVMRTTQRALTRMQSDWA